LTSVAAGGRGRLRVGPLLILVLATGAVAEVERPSSPAALACALSPAHAGKGHRAWWDAVARDPALAEWLWQRIVPEDAGSDACAADVRRVFWTEAVPDGWAPVPDIGGWPRARGGYYAQTLWLQAVPENWAEQPSRSLGRGVYAERGQGYYRHALWEHAIPDGWGARAGAAEETGYYARTFWDHAVPEQWAARPELAVGGRGGRGHYTFWLYHYAVPRDFAWRDDLPGDGGRGAGYYGRRLDGALAARAPYRALIEEARGHLRAADDGVPARRWFGDDARAVVILSFDTEGDADEVCAVTEALRAEAVTATFYVDGRTARSWDGRAQRCLDGFDVASHTDTHPGRRGFPAPGAARALLGTARDEGQRAEIAAGDRAVRAVFPSAAVDGFRTPWCDSYRAFDASVARNLLALRRTDGAPAIRSDSSVATVARAARARGVAPAPGFMRSALADFPFPFLVRPGAAGSDALVELPFSYPSDFVAWAFFQLDPKAAPPARDAAGYAVNLWKDVLDEVYAREGAMIVLMHPFIQAAKGRRPDGLLDFVRFAKAKASVRFTTVHEAAERYRAFAARTR
jgi:peptidoglycan/xylan/chitin deacetylase (PgdA/CDA1 family)